MPVMMGSDAEGRTTVHNGGGYIHTIERPITRTTDLTRLPRKGSHIVQSIQVAGVIVFSGAFVSVCIEILVLAWRIVNGTTN